MRRRIICFVLSFTLILTFIPQITFAVEDAVDMIEDEAATTEEQVEAPAEEPAEAMEEAPAETI